MAARKKKEKDSKEEDYKDLVEKLPRVVRKTVVGDGISITTVHREFPLTDLEDEFMPMDEETYFARLEELGLG